MQDKLQDARDLCAFIDAGPSPYHAVAEAARRLEAAGFTRLLEGDAWNLEAGQAYYVIRNAASLIGFRLGTAHPVEAGFKMVGAHTDSPGFRLKPNPMYVKEGYLQLGVEVYGGPLLFTWVDRDLGLAGRIYADDGRGQLVEHLVRLNEPLCRIPSLAIHLDREVNDKGLVLNRQQHLPPVLGQGLAGDGEGPHGALGARLARDLGIEAQAIRGLDLTLFDLLPSSIGGLNQEFVFAPRLDNLGMSHAAVRALVQAPTGLAATCLISLFDHEEVGSGSLQGASGPFLKDILTRILEGCGQAPGGLSRAVSKSFCVSADMAHAVHPNFADRHDGRHMPKLNGGPVIKANANQRYATDAYSGARFRQLCHEVGVPCQDFITRTDLACGTTIGPITAQNLGIPVVDVGNPMLSMHSVREQCGSGDATQMIQVLTHLFSQ